MLVLGAKGHAKEILDILDKNNMLSNLYFFDNRSNETQDKLFERFPILRTNADVKKLFKTDNRFILGIGGTKARHDLFKTFIESGGEPFSVISDRATIGNFDVILDEGLNIMHYVSVFNRTFIGTGTLINSFASVHHDCRIGEFCEISPGARILGRVSIGDFTSIGSNAVILPDVKVGNNVIVGAGAVVTKDTEDNAVYTGVPAKKIKINPE